MSDYTAPYENLVSWQSAFQLADVVYELTLSFPKREWFALAKECRRTAISICSNIAEGKQRRSDREFRQYLYQARASLAELRTQTKLGASRSYFTASEFDRLEALANKTSYLLQQLINRVESDIRSCP